MTPYESTALLVSILVGSAGAITGLIGLLIAGFANRTAKRTALEAQEANRIATDALAKSAEANRIAEGANRLSADANTLVKRSLSQQEEDWFVDWQSAWLMQQSTLILTNTGRDLARDLSVVVTGQDDLHHAEVDLGNVPAGTPLLVELPEIAARRQVHTQREAARVAGLRGSHIYSAPSSYRNHVSVMIRWKTGLGFPSFKEIEMTVS